MPRLSTFSNGSSWAVKIEKEEWEGPWEEIVRYLATS
jgi:hypothetical protein